MSASPRQALVWSVVNALGTKGTNFLVYLLIARALGPKTFGIVALGLAVTGFLEIVCEHKFSAILIQKAELSQVEKSSIFWFQVTVGLVFALLLLALGGPLGRFFHEPQLTAVQPWLALAMLINTTTYTQETLLKRALQFKVLTIRSMAANLAGGVVGVTMAFNGYGAASMVAMLLTSAAAGSAVLWATSKWRPSPTFSRAAFMPMYRSARYIAATGIAGAGALQANMFIVGHFFGTDVAGLYAFALRIYDVLMRVTTFSISDAAFPIFARKTGDLPEYRSAFVSLLGTGGTVTVGLLMIIGALSPTIISVCFGPQWLPASNYLLIYLLAGAVVSIGAYNDVTLLAFGKTRSVAQAYFAGLIIWLVQLPLLSLFGPLFPAICWCVKEAVLFPVKASWALREMQMSWRRYLLLMVPVVGAGGIAAASAASVQFVLRAKPVTALVVSAGVGVAVFVVAAALMGNRSFSDVVSRLRASARR